MEQIQYDGNRLTDSQILRQWLDTIPRGIYNKVLAILFERCLVSRSKFANWRYGNCRIPASGKRDINSVSLEISGKEIFQMTRPVAASVGASGSGAGIADNPKPSHI